MSPVEGTAGHVEPGGAAVLGNGLSLRCARQGRARGAQGTGQGSPGADVNVGCGISSAVTPAPSDAASPGPVPALGRSPAARFPAAGASGLAAGRRKRRWWGSVVCRGLNWGAQGPERLLQRCWSGRSSVPLPSGAALRRFPPTCMDALSLERRRLLLSHPLYKPECFLFQILNAGILNSL